MWDVGFERVRERGREGGGGKAQIIRSFPPRICPTSAWKESLTGLWEAGWNVVSSSGCLLPRMGASLALRSQGYGGCFTVPWLRWLVSEVLLLAS